jgi:hypothetical protein
MLSTAMGRKDEKSLALDLGLDSKHESPTAEKSAATEADVA